MLFIAEEQQEWELRLALCIKGLEEFSNFFSNDGLKAFYSHAQAFIEKGEFEEGYPSLHQYIVKYLLRLEDSSSWVESQTFSDFVDNHKKLVEEFVEHCETLIKEFEIHGNSAEAFKYKVYALNWLLFDPVLEKEYAAKIEAYANEINEIAQQHVLANQSNINAREEIDDEQNELQDTIRFTELVVADAEKSAELNSEDNNEARQVAKPAIIRKQIPIEEERNEPTQAELEKQKIETERKVKWKSEHAKAKNERTAAQNAQTAKILQEHDEREEKAKRDVEEIKRRKMANRKYAESDFEEEVEHKKSANISPRAVFRQLSQSYLFSDGRSIFEELDGLNKRRLSTSFIHTPTQQSRVASESIVTRSHLRHSTLGISTRSTSNVWALRDSLQENNANTLLSIQQELELTAAQQKEQQNTNVVSHLTTVTLVSAESFEAATNTSTAMETQSESQKPPSNIITFGKDTEISVVSTGADPVESVVERPASESLSNKLAVVRQRANSQKLTSHQVQSKQTKRRNTFEGTMWQTFVTTRRELIPQVIIGALEGNQPAIQQHSVTETPKGPGFYNPILPALHDSATSIISSLTKDSLNGYLQAIESCLSKDNITDRKIILLKQIKALAQAYDYIINDKEQGENSKTYKIFPAKMFFKSVRNNTDLNKMQIQHIDYLRTKARGLALVLRQVYNVSVGEIITKDTKALFHHNTTTFKWFMKEDTNKILGKYTDTELAIKYAHLSRDLIPTLRVR